MNTAADIRSTTLASQARRLYTEALVEGMSHVVAAAGRAARAALDLPAEYQVAQQRRDMAFEFDKAAPHWQQSVTSALRHAMRFGMGASATRPSDVPLMNRASQALTLVDDDTIEREILASRLSLAIADKASWEFADMRSRVSQLERREELDAHDLLRANVVARLILDSWCNSALTLDTWRHLQESLHQEFAALVEESYHEANRWLIEQKVMPEVDLRPLIRRAKQSAPGPLSGYPQATSFAETNSRPMGANDTNAAGLRNRSISRSAEQADAVLDRLNLLVGRHLPQFGDASARAPASPRLTEAIQNAQVSMARGMATEARHGDAVPTAPALLEDLQQRKQSLKLAATTPQERATIEIVALLFQSILTEDRLPAAVRVWFARLQMPVLRVAVTEPDFFATSDHPARRLIDRMGACVMGFDTSSRELGDALELEIKRIVQVVEAYPDTGRRVFQTVLTEFEKFLEHYFSRSNETTRKGVSLAQQVEQRETLAIQYTIELRKMLDQVPVQEVIRQFLFHVWADVLAVVAVKCGAQSEQIKTMRRAAGDLIWSAGAKVSREDRAEVLRRLPPLLKLLREGMTDAGMPTEKQDEQIKALNNALAAAFTAKAAVIPSDRLDELKERLETLEELLPDADDLEIDESMVMDLSGHESNELEVVAEGGAQPSAAMLAWARELQVGSWYMLDYRGRSEAVQLAWQGMRKQLCLFATAQGRCVLFQHQRLAAFLQSGLLVPAQDEALTVRATRSALAKLDVDPSRLLS